MRWKNPKVGDQRIIKRFPLIFPYEINNEARIWETVYVIQRYKTIGLHDYWIDIEFTNKHEYKHFKRCVKKEKKK